MAFPSLRSLVPYTLAIVVLAAPFGLVVADETEGPDPSAGTTSTSPPTSPATSTTTSPSATPSDDDEEDDDREDDARGSGRGPGRNGSSERDDREDEDEGDEDAGDDDDEGPEREPARALGGRLELKDGAAEGRFVSFRLVNGSILDFAYRGAVVVESITFDPPLSAARLKVEGAEFKVEDEGAEFQAVDTPSAPFKAESEEASLALRLAPGYGMVRLDDERLRVTGPDNFTAFLRVEDDARLDGRNLTAMKEVKFLVHAPGLRGDLTPRIGEAVADGTIVAEILLPKAANGSLAPIPIAHGAVNLSAEAASGRLRLRVEGEGPGRALLFNIERDALGRIEDLVIRFDGRAINASDDLADALRADAGEQAEFLLLVGRNATQVVVTVPHFSVHTVDIQGSAVATPIAPTGAAPLALALGAALAVAFVAASWATRNRHR